MTTFNTNVLYLLLLTSVMVFGQSENSGLKQELSFEEYLAYVKAHHPVMKQANLTLSMGEASLLKARGGFDPKIEVDYDRKAFKKTTYYDQLNAAFKVPTWYGIEFKANFEENSGAYLNPNLTVPDGGLYSAGVSFSLAQGFLINERMAALKQARFFRDQTKADRELLVNNLIFEASTAYFEWLEATNEQNVYEAFLQNASTRFKAVERSAALGEKAMIEVTEARIILKNRALNPEEASLKRRKAALKVSNYLWLNTIPLEIQDYAIPVLPAKQNLENSLVLAGITDTIALLDNHPKLLSIDAKIGGLTINRALKQNKLLPKIDLEYHFLSSQFDEINAFNTSNYKAFVNVSFPILLRKERGDLRLANLKLNEANFERKTIALNLKNKINAVQAEIQSLAKQNLLINDIIEDYETMVAAEERKFFLGESSLFLINAREQKLIDAQIKDNTLKIKEFIAIARLYNILGRSLEPVTNN
ncbi:TolC family protein [Lacinutrix neustonica]|uniref:TolC family protein n=1 Tax=Lacinutrix neustonica TaxID=2980107 RepID=A0A9E8MXU8_9FLAO|nr:TolC family protein [Lacinutrix neustonica]WAC02532.1 TolC family protein [Lacinutrix neustonica]